MDQEQLMLTCCCFCSALFAMTITICLQLIVPCPYTRSGNSLSGVVCWSPTLSGSEEHHRFSPLPIPIPGTLYIRRTLAFNILVFLQGSLNRPAIMQLLYRAILYIIVVTLILPAESGFPAAHKRAKRVVAFRKGSAFFVSNLTFNRWYNPIEPFWVLTLFRDETKRGQTLNYSLPSSLAFILFQASILTRFDLDSHRGSILNEVRPHGNSPRSKNGFDIICCEIHIIEYRVRSFEVIDILYKGMFIPNLSRWARFGGACDVPPRIWNCEMLSSCGMTRNLVYHSHVVGQTPQLWDVTIG